MSQMHDETGRSPIYRVLRAVGRFIIGVFVVGYAILDSVLFPLFRPLVCWLSGVRLFEAIGALLLRLPPYVVLLILAVPFVVLEPLKVFALYWFASGHLIQGGVLLVVAHGGSILTLERLYHAGKPQLTKIGWFARLMAWLGGLRDTALRIAKSTAAWRWSSRVAADVRNWLGTLLRSER